MMPGHRFPRSSQGDDEAAPQEMDSLRRGLPASEDSLAMRSNAVEQIERSQNRLARLGRRPICHGLIYLATQQLHRHAIHGGASGEDLGDDLLTGFAIIQHPDDAANLPLNPPEPHLEILIRLIRL
jgi:hypothetical protein